MNLKIKNFGKIAEADIKFDGITVICGENDTGKSTVGKALFCLYNALNDYKNKIDVQKSDKLISAIRNSIPNPMIMPLKYISPENTMQFISDHDGHFTLNEIKEFLESSVGVKLPKDKLKSLVEYLNTAELDILNEFHKHN